MSTKKDKRPKAKVAGRDKVTVTQPAKSVTLDGEEAIKAAHHLMRVGEKALRKAGKVAEG